MSDRMSAERLAAFGAAWNTHDADQVLAYFAPDCAYHASFGPDLLGATFTGFDAVRAGVQAFFDRYPDGTFTDSEVFVAGDRGAAEWTFSATEADGSRLEVRGCDLFRFSGDLIAEKNAFRKNRA